MGDDLIKEALDCRVHASQRAWLELQIKLWNFKQCSIGLKHVSVQILCGLDVKSNLGSLVRQATSLLNLGIFMTALFAAESHDNDLFEEWDRGDAHLTLTISKARVALGRKFDSLLFNITDLV